MGLIINTSIPMMIAGYPTVSDKYNVSGGILEGSTAAKFGSLVMLGSTTGYYKPATSLANVANVAGFIVATNVKVAQGFPGTTVQVNPGEAFNLLLNGYLAVSVDSAATVAQITQNSKVGLILATGAITSADKINSSTIVELPNVVFTGMVENHGTSSAPVYVAEVNVRC